MRKKKELQDELDRLRANPKSFQRNTKEFNRRLKLEHLIDVGLYEKDK